MDVALVIRIDIPRAIMFSDERYEVFLLLHEIVSTLERAAVNLGYGKSRAFAGGSCKRIFCRNHAACMVLSGGECRNPQHARPSMSGFGINVAKMLKMAGCTTGAPPDPEDPNPEPMTWVAGLVMVG
jgi:predicted metal-binding protein